MSATVGGVLARRTVRDPVAKPTDGGGAAHHVSGGGDSGLPLFLQEGARPALAVGPAPDAFEEEADRVAGSLTCGPAGGWDCQGRCDTYRPDDGLPIRSRATPGAPAVSISLPEYIVGSGRPLDSWTRSTMRAHLGHDFGQVRLHTDPRAAAAAQELGALAFTAGRDIVFDSGQYDPTTTHGQTLLAHELVHVVQQVDGRARGIQRAAAPTSAASGPSAGPTYTMDLGGEHFENLTKLQVLDRLRSLYRRLSNSTESGNNWHHDIKRIREDQWIVGGISDFLADPLHGGIKLPPLSIWDAPREALATTRRDLDAGTVETVAADLGRAQEAYDSAAKQFRDYREGTISGAEHAVTGLKVTAAAGAVAATIATGGIAAEAGVGLLGTSAAIGGVGGAYGGTQELAGEASEVWAGLRREVDWATVGRRTAVDAVTNFVGAFAGGALAKGITRAFGSYLGTASDELLVELGKDLGLKGPLPRDFFVSAGQRFFADFVAGLGATPLTTAVGAVINRATGGGGPKSLEEFSHQVLHDLIQGGVMQLFLGTLLHSYGKAPKASAHEFETVAPGGEAGASRSLPPAPEGGGPAGPTGPSTRGGAPQPPRLGGATAEGVGSEFQYSEFPATRMPEVEYAPKPSRAAKEPPAVQPRRAAGVEARAPKRREGFTREDIADVIEEAKGQVPEGVQAAEAVEAMPEGEGRTPRERPAASSSRRTWRVSEVDVREPLEESFGPGWIEHEPFPAPGAKAGERLGSTIPEYYNPRLNTAVEVKNVDLTRLGESMARTKVQLGQRRWSMPAGAKQWIVFDVRGQVVSDLAGSSAAIRSVLSEHGIHYDRVFLLHAAGLMPVP